MTITLPIFGKRWMKPKKRLLTKYANELMKMTNDMGSSDSSYQPGNLVWLYNTQKHRKSSAKLQNSREGPYEFVKRINDVIQNQEGN